MMPTKVAQREDEGQNDENGLMLTIERLGLEHIAGVTGWKQGGEPMEGRWK